MEQLYANILLHTGSISDPSVCTVTLCNYSIHGCSGHVQLSGRAAANQWLRRTGNPFPNMTGGTGMFTNIGVVSGVLSINTEFHTLEWFISRTPEVELCQFTGLLSGRFGRRGHRQLVRPRLGRSHRPRASSINGRPRFVDEYAGYTHVYPPTGSWYMVPGTEPFWYYALE